jgi:hypothetical protein
VRADDEVAVAHVDVADRAVRQVELQRLPMVAVVERHEHAGLGPGVQQARADGSSRTTLTAPARHPAGDRRQVFPRPWLKDDRGEVVELMPIDRGGRSLVECEALCPDLRPGRAPWARRSPNSPSSRDSQIKPSSVPDQIRPSASGESAIA